MQNKIIMCETLLQSLRKFIFWITCFLYRKKYLHKTQTRKQIAFIKQMYKMQNTFTSAETFFTSSSLETNLQTTKSYREGSNAGRD